LQSLAIYDFSSCGSERLVRSQLISSQGFQKLALGEYFREQSSTGNLLSLSSYPFLDSSAQIVHEVFWKINLIKSREEV